jgi:hypothetical protein
MVTACDTHDEALMTDLDRELCASGVIFDVRITRDTETDEELIIAVETQAHMHGTEEARGVAEALDRISTEVKSSVAHHLLDRAMHDLRDALGKDGD